MTRKYRKSQYIQLTILLVVALSAQNLFTQQNTGDLRGVVRDIETQALLIGANVLIDNTDRGTATDSLGRYTIKDLLVGQYNVRFNYIGHQSVVKTDVIVRPARITYLDCDLSMTSVQTRAINVTADYFARLTNQTTSAVTFTNEEIRRAPGAAGDVSRILMMLPSVAKINDQVNSLIVRGGSPMENGFYVDNIEIPNINHFPVQGAASGSIGLLNVDFIKDVNFYTGGFPAKYGDKLSSIMDIQYREGNRAQTDGQLDLGFAGIGGIGEGPIFSGKGSWMLAARRSYLDLLLDLLNFTVTPMYGDIQGKIVYDLNPRNKISLLNIFGLDRNTLTKAQASEQDIAVYGYDDHTENTIGINWRKVWNKDGFSQTSISQNISKFRRDFSEFGTDTQVVKLNSNEEEYHLRNMNRFRLSDIQSIEFGLDATWLNYRYDNLYGAYTDVLGNPTFAIIVNNRIQAARLSAFASYAINPVSLLEFTIGVRISHFTFTEKSTITPRVSVKFHPSDRIVITAAAGIFAQNVPINLMAQLSSPEALETPHAIHYILGMDYRFSPGARFTIEGYHKAYSQFPMDPKQPALFIIDEMFYRDGFYMGHNQLVSTGSAEANGIEVMLQKKLVSNLYGVISASVFQAIYRDISGKWRPRIYDNRYLLNIEGGYRPNNRWELSGRWIYAGGRPYTPFDVAKSVTLNRAVVDSSRINAARLPAYHSLNLRVDRRFQLHASNIVAYISLWNVYNQKNVASYYWNRVKKQVDKQFQWSLLPIFGVEYEF